MNELLSVIDTLQSHNEYPVVGENTLISHNECSVVGECYSPII